MDKCVDAPARGQVLLVGLIGGVGLVRSRFSGANGLEPLFKLPIPVGTRLQNLVATYRT
jgi:hypothetical protein